MKFHKNPYSGSRVFHANGQTDTTKLMVAIRNFAYTPENSFFIWPSIADRGTPSSEDSFPSVSGVDGWVRGGKINEDVNSCARRPVCFLRSFLGRSLGLAILKANALFTQSSNITSPGGCSLNRPRHAVVTWVIFFARVCPLMHHTLVLIPS
jgi:hypothetical protein